ncbi:MAG: uroporphyrinogen decarboxylase family protein [Selenomonadaceae bacterium]|nr:uroporphyrinogen decarboxylase family protein [Selenomonadaceae bacterium]
MFKALECQEVDRTPWVPYAGVQTANLLEGVDAEAFLKDADKIVEGFGKAYEKYTPDALPILFDIQMEAEAIGCELKWSKNNPPAVATHVLEDDSCSVADLPRPDENSGRYPVTMEAARRIVKLYGDKIVIYALICGPLTLALHLRGVGLFSDMIRKKTKERADELLAYCASIGKDIARMYRDVGVDVIAVVDPMVSQISPKHFESFVKGPTTDLNTYIREELKLYVMSFSCGDATKNLELMCETNTHGIAFDENVDLAYAKEVAQKHHVAYGGNLPLTTIMLFGTPSENVAEAKRELEIGKGAGYILSPGCDIPYNTPIPNLVAIADYVSGNYTSLEDFPDESLADDGEDFEDVAVEPGKVFIEVITLDSEGCAPCQYMCESVRGILGQYEGKISWRESLVKTKAGIRRMKKLGVANLPVMLINNEVVFNNIVPTRAELIEAIDKRL